MIRKFYTAGGDAGADFDADSDADFGADFDAGGDSGADFDAGGDSGADFDSDSGADFDSDSDADFDSDSDADFDAADSSNVCFGFLSNIFDFLGFVDIFEVNCSSNISHFVFFGLNPIFSAISETFLIKVDLKEILLLR